MNARRRTGGPVRAGIVWALVLPACGLTARQQAAVRTFGAATIDFATVASTELVKSRTDVLEMNALRAQLQDRALTDGRMDRFFTVERVKTRMDALAALGRYATLLHALVTTSHAEALQQASTFFVASLRKVDGVTLSDAKAVAISAAVARVGGLLVERMRAQAVKTVVTEADAAVLALVGLVRRDFDPEADHLSLGYETVVEALGGAADLAARRDGARDPALVAAARVTAERNRERVAAVAARVTAAADAIAAAHANLRAVVQSRDVAAADVERFAGQIEDFVTIYAILRDE